MDLEESEGKDYNHLGGLDQLDQLKKELRYKIKLLGPRQTLNFSLFSRRQEQQGGNTPKPPKLSVLG